MKSVLAVLVAVALGINTARNKWSRIFTFRKMQILGLLLAVAILAGCASVSYDGTGFSSKTLGKDVNLSGATWTKITSNSVESITLNGNAGSSATETTHMIGNVALGAIGALIGSSGGPVGTGVGAAAGTSVAEIWQTIQGYLNKTPAPTTNAPAAPVVTPTPVPVPTPTPAPVTPAAAIVDPLAGNPHVGYGGTGADDITINVDGHSNIHCLANDRDAKGNKLDGGVWIAASVVAGKLHITNNVLTVDPTIDDGNVHLVYLGLQEPTGDSPFVTGNPVTLPTTGGGDKTRLFFSSVSK